ncbi:MAG: MBL fold metallo-hydrolase [Woeseiaceae bacterium]|nr:MBL fold metallo-hydrolase [Woeseiaceae bacterium]
MNRLVLCTVFTLLSAQSGAHETMSVRELMLSFGTDLDTAEVRRETISPGLHVLYAAGGNVAVSIGEQGVLMVDSQFPEMIPKLKAAIADLGGGDVDFTINTHSHFDHVNGNPLLGREGSWMISQLNTRNLMLSARTVDLLGRLHTQGPYPTEALPVVTFEDRMQVFFNGQRIDIMHFGPGHTSGDAVVIFRGDNAVHMGDLLTGGFPFIDTNFGGQLDGLIKFCKAVLANIDENTTVIPGHGPLKSYQDLADHVVMMETVGERIRTMIDRGYSLEDVLEANPAGDFAASRGDPTLFIHGAYRTLTE